MELSRLNDAERRVLRLLAAGHTAKSIADATGTSVNAVNERLREARRKTGAGSSRELARALADAQENRDEFPGVAEGPDDPPAPPGKPARSRRGIVLLGALAMLAFVIALAAPFLATPEGPPRMVSSNPGQGARVAAGRVEIRVTFDRPMQPGSYSFVVVDPATYPDCANVAAQSADGRSFTLACTLAPERNYTIGFNSRRFRGFRDAEGGEPATPAVLRFSTR